MKEKLQKYYTTEGYYVIVREEIKFKEFSVLKCSEYNPLGPSIEFEIIAKNGKFYNSNFDDIVEINNETKIY